MRMKKQQILIWNLFLIGIVLIHLGNRNISLQPNQTISMISSMTSQPITKQNEWIIKWKKEYPKEILKDTRLINWLPELKVTRLQLKENVNVSEWLKKWIDDPNIEYMQPNLTVRISQVPNDLFYPKQTYLKRIHMEKAWEQVTKNSNITIAILDTGVDLEHPDLKPNLVDGINLLDKKAKPQDDNGHGTNVAGIVAAVGNNSIGIAGILWRAKLMPVKVLDKKGEGDSFLVGQGIRYAVDHGADIILLSLGEPVFTPFMKEAVDYAVAKNVLIVAASGNEGNQLNYPAAFSSVLSVGAVDQDDEYARYSNYGQQLDVVAPGDGIYTTQLGGQYTANSGTSMAAPQVAGLAALLYQKYPDLTPKEVENIIKFSADDVDQPGWDEKTGYGKINAIRALNFPLERLKDGFEPNNTKETATPFPYNDTFFAQLTLNQDVDWYKLNLPYHGVVDFQLNLEKSLTSPIQITVFPNGTNRNFIYKIKNSTKITLNLPQGLSYIKLEYSDLNQKGMKTDQIRYSLTNQYRINQDQFENNDNLRDAYLLENLQQIIKGTFHKEHDWDWYQIEVNQSGELTVSVSVDTNRLDPVIWFQAKGKHNIEIDEKGSGEKEEKTIPVSPGTYYVRLADYNGYEVIGEYQLYFQLTTSDGDTHEPNDFPLEATPLNGDHLMTKGVILNEKDQDWYQFFLTQPSAIQIQVTNTQNKKIRAVLYNSKLDVLLESQGTSINQTVSLDKGNYYLRVDAQSPLTSYQIIFNDQMSQKAEQ
ncbi:S8 family peptidase [Tepidibacillus sp. LV47]|uniref:S8 family peptidase n=1 Tax=Tepidibacillus sp. LV47 TaxID=3398228 RepID=UPI003AAD848F